jgi:ketosteroid isomerase-like protein
VPFDEIAAIVGRSPDAARQLASRGRRRVRGANPMPDADPVAQREVVDAFFAAARDGDFDALVAVLDPDAVLRVHRDGTWSEVHGASTIARRARSYAQIGLVVRPALVNGAPGAVSTRDGEPFSVMGCTVRDGRIVEMDILADADQLRGLDLTILDA